MNKMVDFRIVNRREQHAFSLKTVDFHIVNRCETRVFVEHRDHFKTIIDFATHENLLWF